MGDQVHPGEMGYTAMVMIPKVNVDTKGIGMLEAVWKVLEAAIDTRIKSVVQFHNVLQGFCAGRGAETAIMELKLVQDLESMDQDTLLLVFLDLRNSCNDLDRWILLQTLEGYGSGPKLRGSLAEFWSRQELVTFQNGFHEPQLQYNRVITQGGLSSPTLLNVALDIVVHHWMSLKVKDESATHEGLWMAVGQ